MHNKRMQSDQQIVTLVRGFSKADARFKETSGDLRHIAAVPGYEKIGGIRHLAVVDCSFLSDCFVQNYPKMIAH